MTAIQFAGLMYGGVPEKFPKLNVAFLECGVGWLPYWVERLDEEYEKRAPEAPLLKAKPSEYLKNGTWFCSTEPEEHGIAVRHRAVWTGNDPIRFRLSTLGRIISQCRIDDKKSQGHYR